MVVTMSALAPPARVVSQGVEIHFIIINYISILNQVDALNSQQLPMNMRLENTTFDSFNVT